MNKYILKSYIAWNKKKTFKPKKKKKIEKEHNIEIPKGKEDNILSKHHNLSEKKKGNTKRRMIKRNIIDKK